MAEHIDLRSAPITEALIDFRIPLQERLTPVDLQPVREALIGRYPDIQEHNAMQAQFEIKDGKPVTKSELTGFHGLFFKTADGLDVAQFRRDGFTVNRLAPYRGWEQLIASVLELLPLYVRHVRPSVFDRIAVRFINRVLAPVGPAQPLSEFLTIPPKLADGVGATLEAFVSRISISDAKTGNKAFLIQSMEAGEISSSFMLIDIDVFTDKPRPAEITSIEVSELLEGLRDLKNRIFFGTITDRALAPYR